MSLIEIFKVTVDHFRGYRDKKVFDFENGADIIILAGSNGYGKTSFFDAIEWGFTGKLSRFEEPNEEKGNSCFINFQPFERSGKVCIEFGNKDVRYYLTRESTFSITDSTDYSYKKSSLCLRGSNISSLYNEEAIEFLNKLLIKEEWRNRIEFTDIFSQYHVLTQDKIKRFIQGLKGPDRYKQISMMVGTQKFYSYKSFFEKYEKTFKENIKALGDKKNLLQVDINSIKKLISSDIKINIGDCKSIEDWISLLIDRYNIILEQFNIEKYVNNKDSNMLDIAVDLKKHSIEAKENIKNIKINNISFKDKLINILHSLETYENNKEQFKIYSEVLPFFDKGQKLLKLKSQLPSYRQYNSYMKDNELNELKINELLKQIELYLFKLTTLYNQVNFLIKESGIEESTENKLEKYLTNKINFLQNNIPKFDDINEIIIDSNSISFLEYKQEIEIDLQERKNLNDFIKMKVELYRNGIRDILDNILGIEEGMLSLEKKSVIVEDKIKLLSKLASELKNILTESLTYVKNNNSDLHSEVKCPVCDSDFNKEILVKKIEEKLANDNQEISLKLKEKQDIETDIRNYRQKIAKSRELDEQLHEDFVKTVEDIKNAIKLLGQLIRRKENELNNKLKNLNDEKIKVNERQSSIISLIDSMNLSKNLDELEDGVTFELDEINYNLKQNNLMLESFTSDEIKNIILDNRKKIDIFECKLEELKIDKKNVKKDIENKIDETNKQIFSLDEIEKKLKILEENFNEAHKALDNSEKIKELKILEDSYKELSIQEKDESKKFKILENLVIASIKAIQEISEEILSQHQEFINTIYKRINPHPLFTEVEFNFDKNAKGNDILNISCVNRSLNNKVNPAFTFSSAQVNVVAVSIFLGMALRQQCSNLKTIMLDDPIQNMDDINVISFIDILRNCMSLNGDESNGKQVIISTHDQDFYRLMIKKFRFIKSRSFEFVTYNNKGPEIRF